jgi:hypothetical protein
LTAFVLFGYEPTNATKATTTTTTTTTTTKLYELLGIKNNFYIPPGYNVYIVIKS